MSRVFDASQTGVNETNLLTPPNAVYNNLNAFTLAAWVYPTASDSFGVIFAKDPQVSYGQDLALINLALIASASYSVTIANSQSNETVALNTWSHIAATFDKATDALVHLYINGVETTYTVGQTPGVGTIVDNSANGWMSGNDTFDDGYTGRIAEQAIWNVALTAGQVATLAASTTGAAAVQPTHLVGYWHLCGTSSPEPDATANGDNAVLSANPPTPGPNSPGFDCPRSISGSVGASGAGATIKLTGTSTATTTAAGGTGNYTFTGLLDGPYTVAPGLTGFAFSPTNRVVNLAGADITGVNFLLFTPSPSGSNSSSVMGSGPNFATRIESPNTSIIGTNLHTEIRK